MDEDLRISLSLFQILIIFVTALATLAIAYFAGRISTLQKNEFLARRVSNIELSSIHSADVEGTGKTYAHAQVEFTNTSEYEARDVTFIQSHKPGKKEQWLGFLPGWYLKKNQEWDWNDKINIIQDNVVTYLVSQSRAGGKKELCDKAGEESVYFAFRIGWKNPNRSKGCKIWYLNIQCLPSGMGPKEKTLFVNSTEGIPPKGVEEAPAIGRCPGEVFYP